MLLALPHDLTLLVVEHILQAHSLCALEACCKALRELVDDDVWRRAYLRRHRRSILASCACASTVGIWGALGGLRYTMVGQLSKH